MGIQYRGHVKFVSTNPYRMVVTGRIKHFISAFGEHVIGEEVEYSLMKAAKEEGIQINEFTVAPYIKAARRRKIISRMVYGI